VGGFAGLPDLIRGLGADPQSLFVDAGLSPHAFDDPDGRISHAAIAWILQEGALRTGCAHIGLLAGHMWQLADHGVVGEIAANSKTVRDALEAFTTHQQAEGGGALAFLSCHASVVDFGYAMYHPYVSGTGQLYDAMIAAGFNLLRSLCGPAWRPTEVLVPHARPVDTSPYGRLLKVHPRFDDSAAVIRFPSHWLDQRLAGTDPVRLAHALHAASDSEQGDFTQQVVRGLRLLLLRGHSSADDLAANMRMHRRTLNRRLQARGTTIQEVIDAVRLDVARELLAESHLSLDDIADALAYAGVTPFIRSFNRLTGTTPGRWRRATMSRQGLAAAPSCRRRSWHGTQVSMAAD